MKQVKFLLLAAFVAMFTGCQNEEIMEQDSVLIALVFASSLPFAVRIITGI